MLIAFFLATHYVAASTTDVPRPPPIMVPLRRADSSDESPPWHGHFHFDWELFDDVRQIAATDYIAECQRGLVPLSEWDTYIAWFTEEVRPSRRRNLSTTTEDLHGNEERRSPDEMLGPWEDTPRDRVFRVLESPLWRTTSSPGYSEPALYRSKAFDMMSDRPKDRANAWEVSDLGNSLHPLRSLIPHLRDVAKELRLDENDTSAEYEAILESSGESINLSLYNILMNAKILANGGTFDCRMWIGVLEQAQLRTAIHFAKRPGDWRIFADDIVFVIETLVAVLTYTE
jgi:hypothetical protein